MELNLDTALKIIKASKRKAEELEVSMVIAVLDEGGNLIAQHRMDNAIFASVDISLNKAYTSVATKMPTHVLGEASQVDQPLFGINTTNNGRLVIFGGGYPITNKDGMVIGAIGVSGGDVEEDMSCAKAGLEFLE
ncbi:MAG: heme-binding protein [Halanaerobium sp. MSAO_Bac5]|nr:MAG: heme-binding protein [Halanaerobium sp. MSAO_Bac5]